MPVLEALNRRHLNLAGTSTITKRTSPDEMVSALRTAADMRERSTSLSIGSILAKEPQTQLNTKALFRLYPLSAPESSPNPTDTLSPIHMLRYRLAGCPAATGSPYGLKATPWIFSHRLALSYLSTAESEKRWMALFMSWQQMTVRQLTNATAKIQNGLSQSRPIVNTRRSIRQTL